MVALGGEAPADIKPNQLQAAAVVIDEQQKSARYKGQLLDLTPVEYRLLRALVQRPDTILSYAEVALITHNVNIDESEARALLRTHLYRLGRKLEVEGASPLQTVRGQGVKFSRVLEDD